MEDPKIHPKSLPEEEVDPRRKSRGREDEAEARPQYTLLPVVSLVFRTFSSISDVTAPRLPAVGGLEALHLGPKIPFPEVRVPRNHWSTWCGTWVSESATRNENTRYLRSGRRSRGLG